MSYKYALVASPANSIFDFSTSSEPSVTEMLPDIKSIRSITDKLAPRRFQSTASCLKILRPQKLTFFKPSFNCFFMQIGSTMIGCFASLSSCKPCIVRNLCTNGLFLQKQVWLLEGKHLSGPVSRIKPESRVGHGHRLLWS